MYITARKEFILDLALFSGTGSRRQILVLGLLRVISGLSWRYWDILPLFSKKRVDWSEGGCHL